MSWERFHSVSTETEREIDHQLLMTSITVLMILIDYYQLHQYCKKDHLYSEAFVLLLSETVQPLLPINVPVNVPVTC